jgi:pimeloyl-[acyl-carrier protein] methyl ester esterase
MSKINIVFLPGWIMPVKIFQEFSEKFENANIYLLDLPGIGMKKNMNIESSLDAYAQVLLQEAPEKAVWIGWSLGGLIATYITLMNPERVIALINMTSSPRFLPDKVNHWPGLGLETVKQFASNLVNDFRTTLLKFIQLQFYGLKDNRAFKQLQLIKNFPWSDIASSPEPALKGLELIKNSDLRAELHQIQQPILYLLGRLDTLVPIGIAPLLKNYNQHAEVECLAKASHAPFLTHPEESFELINNFLKRHMYE